MISEVVGNLVAVRLVVSKRCQGVSLTGGTLALHVLCSPPLRRWGRERLRGTAATDPCGSTLISSGFVNCDLIKSRVRGHAGGSRSRQPALASRGNTRTHGTKNPETEIHRNAKGMAKVGDSRGRRAGRKLADAWLAEASMIETGIRTVRERWIAGRSSKERGISYGPHSGGVKCADQGPRYLRVNLAWSHPSRWRATVPGTTAYISDGGRSPLRARSNDGSPPIFPTGEITPSSRLERRTPPLVD